MQNQVGHVLFRLTLCGLNVNILNCATLNIIINPNKKQWICIIYYVTHIVFISIDNLQLKR